MTLVPLITLESNGVPQKVRKPQLRISLKNRYLCDKPNVNDFVKSQKWDGKVKSQNARLANLEE